MLITKFHYLFHASFSFLLRLPALPTGRQAVGRLKLLTIATAMLANFALHKEKIDAKY